MQLGLDPAAPGLLSEKEFRKQGVLSEHHDSTGGSPWQFCLTLSSMQ